MVDSTGGTVQTSPQAQPNTCPGCGRCKHCGQPNFYPQYPYYAQPYWYNNPGNWTIPVSTTSYIGI